MLACSYWGLWHFRVFTIFAVQNSGTTWTPEKSRPKRQGRIFPRSLTPIFAPKIIIFSAPQAPRYAKFVARASAQGVAPASARGAARGHANFCGKWSTRRSEGVDGTSGFRWFQRVPLSLELLPPRGTLGDPFFSRGGTPPEATRCRTEESYYYSYQVWKRWNHDTVILL